MSKHNRKDCSKRTGRGTPTSSYTPTDVKSDPEHISVILWVFCDVSLDVWCLEDHDLIDIMSDSERKHKRGMVKLKRERFREVQRRKEWSLKHHQGGYSDDLNCAVEVTAKSSQVEKFKV